MDKLRLSETPIAIGGSCVVKMGWYLNDPVEIDPEILKFGPQSVSTLKNPNLMALDPTLATLDPGSETLNSRP